MNLFVPYRICPLGAHIDHQKGKVLGITIDRGTILKFNKIEGKVKIKSINFNEEIEFDIKKEEISPCLSKREVKWYDLIKGCVYILKENFDIKFGIEGEIYGELPSGGIGSSASAGLSFLISIEYVNNIKVSKEENIFLFKRVENEYLGVKSGILDQSTILLSNDDKNSILYLDCKDLKYGNVKSEKEIDYSIVMVYSGIERVLYDTGYNKRVDECKEACLKILEFSGEKINGDVFLRDIDKSLFLKYSEKLPENLRKRAEHFYGEIERVERGIELWKKGEIEEFGKLIKNSGESSIKNYECGSPELIKICDILNSIDGVYGARFSGAGFRGWVFGFIKNDEKLKGEIKRTVENEYLKDYPQYKGKFKIIFVENKKVPTI